MAGQLEGKVALITGAGSGIGRATALVFAREGARVVVSDVDDRGGNETVGQVRGGGSEATYVHADVTKTAEVEAMVKAAVDTYGRLDCAFNNAGIEGDPGGPIHEYSEELWRQVVDVNLTGVWLCMKYETGEMLHRGGGTIVNAGSVYSLVANPGGSSYNASKYGVIGLTQTVALEYARQGIRVNAVCPGYIHTPMMDRVNTRYGTPEYQAQVLAKHPIGRVGRPEEVAEAVLWLCSDASSFVTGHAMAVDGGFVAQ